MRVCVRVCPHHSTEVVIGALAGVASSGCAVIMSLHQPTSKVFKSFHKVLCLTATGHTLYCGPPMEAVAHVNAVAGDPHWQREGVFGNAEDSQGASVSEAQPAGEVSGVGTVPVPR